MNKKILILALVIGIGSFVTIAYATNTTITNTSVSTTTVSTSDLVASHDVNTTNLFVTGTCTGCGVNEGNFNNYNTFPILLNTTFGNGQFPNSVMISNDGTVSASDRTNTYVINSLGFVIVSGQSGNVG